MERTMVFFGPSTKVLRNFFLVLCVTRMISPGIGQSTGAPKLHVTASSTFQMLLSQSPKRLNSMELQTLKEVIASQLLSWQVQVATGGINDVYDDTEIVFQDSDYNPALKTTSIRFFALGTSSSPVQDGNEEAIAEERQNDLNDLITDAFESQRFESEVLDLIQSSTDDDESPSLRSITNIEAFLLAPAPIPTPSPIAVSENKRRFSTLDAILVFVSTAIFFGVMYMIIQHHIDQGYFENQRLQALNAQQISQDRDGNDDTGFSATLIASGRVEQKGDSEAPSTPSTIESILREEDAEFMIPQISTPKRKGLGRIVSADGQDFEQTQPVEPENVHKAISSFNFQEENESYIIQHDPSDMHDQIDLEKAYQPIDIDSTVLPPINQIDFTEARRISFPPGNLDLKNDEVDDVPKQPNEDERIISDTEEQHDEKEYDIELQDTNTTTFQRPIQLTSEALATFSKRTVDDHLSSTRQSALGNEIVVETVTSLSSGYNSNPPTNILAESFDSDWFLDSLTKSKRRQKKDGTNKASDDSSRKSTSSEDYFGVDVDATQSAGGGSQKSKASTKAITEWMKTIQVKARASTGSKTSIMSHSGSTEPSFEVRKEKSQEGQHSSSGVSSSNDSSSSLYDSTSTSLSSLDRLSITHSMASSANGASIESSSSSESDQSKEVKRRQRRTRKANRKRKLPRPTKTRVDV